MSADCAWAVAQRCGRFEDIFPIFGLEQAWCAAARILGGCEAAQGAQAGACQAAIAAISGLTPTMFMTRVRL
jgi:hypothetical protein